MTTPLTISFKRLHPDAVAPMRAHEYDAGWDLTALTAKWVDGENGATYLECKTGIGVAIPPGYVGLLVQRSSARKTGMSLCNCVGTIDAGYIGDLTFSFRAIYTGPEYQVGDRIGQLVILPLPVVEMVETDELGVTARGTNGHGSTGK